MLALTSNTYKYRRGVSTVQVIVIMLELLALRTSSQYLGQEILVDRFVVVILLTSLPY